MEYAAKIEELLSKYFINYKDPLNILKLGFATTDDLKRPGQNILMYGPAGHGKSEMTRAVVEGLGLKDRAMWQFFGEGMDEARIFGCVNFKKLSKDKVLEYHTDRSFLNHDIAIFEELFDAPPSVLMVLKDVLSSGFLRNGAQQVPIKTKLVIALTNKSPNEISELGPSAHALIERFPLQLEVSWKSYSSSEYVKLYEKLESYAPSEKMSSYGRLLASVMAKATAEGSFISPRSAINAYKACEAALSSSSAGANHMTLVCDALKYIPGLEKYADNMVSEYEITRKRESANNELHTAYTRAKDLILEASGQTEIIEILKGAKQLDEFAAKVAGLSVYDGIVEKRDEILNGLSQTAENLREKAISMV